MAVKKRLGLLGKPIIVPFRGFGDSDRFWCRGRVIENQGVISAPHRESTLQNIWLTLKRYETDEIPDARLTWSHGGKSGEVVTDEEGYFDFSFEPGGGIDPDAPWQAVEMQLIDAPRMETAPLGAEVRVRTPPPQARLGVISDIDDTIVKTGAYDFLKHWRTVVANSAESRQAFPGIAALYRGLARENGVAEANPVFYVSSSPWNLFDLFERFMILNDIPVGPMLLKDFGLTGDKWLTGGHDGHKTAMINRIMERYPDIRFVLVGDSGQRDAVIYRQIAMERSDRVAAVFIREVSGNGDAGHMTDLRETLADLSIPYASGPDLGEAAVISCDHGWIGNDDVEAVNDAVADARRAV